MAKAEIPRLSGQFLAVVRCLKPRRVASELIPQPEKTVSVLGPLAGNSS
jgi:hypothetical protein